MDLAISTDQRRDGRDIAMATTLPASVTRGVGALLALAVALAHVADQGGVTEFTSPDWLGWGYRMIEVGGVLVAAVLSLWPRAGRLGWAAGALLAVGPFVGYFASRTIGVPGDPGDVGNWSDWVGTLALTVEAGLMTISAGMILAMTRAHKAQSFAAPQSSASPQGSVGPRSVEAAPLSDAQL